MALTPEAIARMNTLSREDDRKLWAEDAASSVGRSRSDSVCSGSTVNLEEGTSIRTTGFSRGFLAGHFMDRDDVPCVPIAGTQIKNHSGLLSFVAKHLQTYYVKRVLSPFEFYLERESDTKSEERLRHEKMQKFYENEEIQAFEYSIQVSKMKCYAYYDPHSKSWWRVRVLDYEFEGDVNRAYIYYCDTGKQEYILCESLRQLHDEFQGASDSAILKCYLYDVLPISGNLHWSMDAIVYFKELISNQRLGAVVMKCSQNPVVEYSPDLTFDCGVVLTEKLDPNERPDTINWLMVKMGFARSIGIMSSSQSVLDIPGLIPSFTAAENTVKPKEEVQDWKPISFEELRRITSQVLHNPAPDRGVPVYCDKPGEPLSNPDNFLPYNIRCRLAWMRMSFVEGPDKIFIHMQKEKLELKAMEAEMKIVCHSLPKPTLESLEPGSLVTCDMRDPNYVEADAWCRAVVLKIYLSNDAASVLMVDYGTIMTVHINVIHPFPEKYRSIPSFVHRVHLSDIRANFDVLYWREIINRTFFKYVISHEEDAPLYYIHVPDNGDIVKFTDIEQGLIFNDIENKWVANDPKMSEENEVINGMRNDPLLASYFCSHAVHIFFEVGVNVIKFWEFENISQFLVKNENAIPVKAKLDREKLHEILKNGFGTL